MPASRSFLSLRLFYVKHGGILSETPSKAGGYAPEQARFARFQAKREPVGSLSEMDDAVPQCRMEE